MLCHCLLSTQISGLAPLHNRYRWEIFAPMLPIWKSLHQFSFAECRYYAVVLVEPCCLGPFPRAPSKTEMLCHCLLSTQISGLAPLHNRYRWEIFAPVLPIS